MAGCKEQLMLQKVAVEDRHELLGGLEVWHMYRDPSISYCLAAHILQRWNQWMVRTDC